jgi:hypothetical protein
MRYLIGLVIAVSKPAWLNVLLMNMYTPIPVVVRSKHWVCGCLLAGIVGSNPTGSMEVCRECCVFSGRGLYDGPIPRP